MTRFLKKIFSKFYYYTGAILFIAMMIFPLTYKYLKAPLLAIVLIFTFFRILITRKMNTNLIVLQYFLLYLVFGLFWTFWGVVNDKKFVLDFFRLHFVWTIVYFFLVISVSDYRVFYKLEKIMVLSVFLISILSINYFLYGLGIQHINILTELKMGQAVGIHEGYSQLNNINIGTLFFLMPFLFSRLFIMRNKKGTRWKIEGFIFLLGLITIFISGRRMLIFIIILTPLIYYTYVKFLALDRLHMRNLMIFIIIVILILTMFIYFFYGYLDWDFNNLIDRITFQGKYGEGLEYRINKVKELIDEASRENVFLGTGGGSPSFEVTFFRIFNETGIIGFWIYNFLYLQVYLFLSYIVRVNKSHRIHGVPIVIGAICFYLAMWSNPFGSYDFLWTIFLPVVFINLYLQDRKKDICNE